jgi:uncharacterized protein YndB with AHSA1/START domain
MTNSIEKTIDVKAPIDRVWRALSDYREFGQWFRVNLDGPFEPGKVSRGHITYPGYEHLKWEATVKAMDAPGYFALTWHPYAVDPDADYSSEPPTLIEFRLEPIKDGTRVTVKESGFDKLPAGRRIEAIRSNTGGWEEQMRNIKAHVES